MKCWLVDIDGTLANTDHRNHHLNGEKKKWKEWYAAQKQDVPYWDIVEIIHMAKDTGIKIVLCTGRDENNRSGTLEWLKEHKIHFDELFMRPANDRRDDTIVKKELLDKIREKGYDPVCVFEDRDRVVKMWRDEGLRCLQVKPGEY